MALNLGKKEALKKGLKKLVLKLRQKNTHDSAGIFVLMK